MNEEKQKTQEEAMRRSAKEWEDRKKAIADKVAHRALLIEQAGGKRSVEAMRLEELQKAYEAIKEVTEQE